MATPRGKVIPPAENGFITFRPLSTPFARGPPTRSRLNGDDRIAADHEQSRVTPNSARDLPRQVTIFFPHRAHRGNTSSRADPTASLCHHARTAGPGCTNSWNSASSHRPLLCLLSTIDMAQNSAGSAYYHAEKACPAPERGARERCSAGLSPRWNYNPAWVRSWSALSVRSQVKPSPVRPKWP